MGLEMAWHFVACTLQPYPFNQLKVMTIKSTHGHEVEGEQRWLITHGK